MHSPKAQVIGLALTAFLFTTGAHSCGGPEGPPPPADKRSWNDRVEGWLDGQYCDYAYESEYYDADPDYQPHDFGASKLRFQPSPEYRSQLSCKQAECIWVECFGEEMQIGSSGSSGITSDYMCNNFQGPWKDKCEFDHYVPGILAFAGPGEKCGYVYPECPDAVYDNCFCGEEVKEAFYADWCDGGKKGDWCPDSHQYDDGRTQPCNSTGWTFSPQNETVNGTWHSSGFEGCGD